MEYIEKAHNTTEPYAIIIIR